MNNNPEKLRDIINEDIFNEARSLIQNFPSSKDIILFLKESISNLFTKLSKSDKEYAKSILQELIFPYIEIHMKRHLFNQQINGALIFNDDNFCLFEDIYDLSNLLQMQTLYKIPQTLLVKGTYLIEDFLNMVEEIPLTNVQILKIDRHFKLENIIKLMQTNQLPNLVDLNLHYLNLGPEELEEMATNNPFPKLERLSFKSCKIGAEGLKFITALPVLQQITHLDISGNNITNAGLEYLIAEAVKFNNLLYLDIRHNDLDPNIVNQLKYILPNTSIIS